MLREIFAAIFNAMGRVCLLTGRLIKGAILFPFNLFAGGGRPSMPRIDAAAIKERASTSPAVTNDVQQSLLRDSIICWSFVSGSLGDRNMRPMPSALSRRMQSWVAGLDYAQLVAIKTAGAMAVFAHSTGNAMIAGVPAVGPLTPVSVRFPPLSATVDKSFESRLVRRFA